MIDRTDVIAAARAHIGTPFCDRAHQRGVEVDCFGLITLVAEDVGAGVPDMDQHIWPSLQDVIAGLPKWMDPLDGPELGCVVVIAPGRATAARPRLHYAILTDSSRFSPMGMVHSTRGLRCVREVSWSTAWQRHSKAFFALRRAS